MNSELFIKLPPRKLFFRCAVPAAITSVAGALYAVVDGMFVGRFIGEDALAAISITMPVIMMVEAIANMIATGASVNIAIHLGKKERATAARIFSFAVKFILAFSCLTGLLGYFFARPFVMLLAPGASAHVIGLSVTYLQIYALFAPLIPIYFATDNFLRDCGQQRVSMLVNVATQLLNVALDFILIVLLGQGIAGAAIGSCLSLILGSLFTLACFRGRRLDLYYTRGNIPLRKFFRLMLNGSSEFFSNIAASVMSIVLNIFLLKYGGTTAVAAFSIIMYIDSMLGMLNFGICEALQPAISYCYGAGRILRMNLIFRSVRIAMMVIAAVSFLLMLLAGPFAASLFIRPDDAELTAVSLTGITIFAFSYLPGWIDMCYSSYFTALDRPTLSLLVSLCGTLLFPLAFLILFASLWGLTGIWLMVPAAALASSLLTLHLARNIR
ncbi:putative efflux protein, MATE family [Selenomonas sp. GACV-9]|uniref:MATE family efflux transporter n=1 Tax=Selenomonas sp. GACV-9 TaxID=3158782 RepID=UPI0008F14A87|nr:putative efflux protein, MATE family [Selenomonas ruminantium]